MALADEVGANYLVRINDRWRHWRRVRQELGNLSIGNRFFVYLDADP